jgi:hypothetical protein
VKHHHTAQQNQAMPKAPATTQTKGSLLKTSLTLAVSKCFMVGFTQPIHVVMRMQQLGVKDGKSASMFETAKRLYSKQNLHSNSTIRIAPFYKGFSAASSKEFGKYFTYKTSVIGVSPELAAKYFPSSLRHEDPTIQHLSIAAGAGVIASSADTAIGGPLERLATYRATSQGHNKNANFLTELKKHGNSMDKFKFIYQGSSASFLKTGVGFFTLFATSAPIQKSINNAFGLQPGDKIPLSASALTALSTGFAVALTSSPLDITKTLAQAPRSEHTGNPTSVVINNIKTMGLKAVTTGLPAKILMTVLGWGLVNIVTQQTKKVPEHNTYQYK